MPRTALVKFLPVSLVRNWHKSFLGKLVSMVDIKANELHGKCLGHRITLPNCHYTEIYAICRWPGIYVLLFKTWFSHHFVVKERISSVYILLHTFLKWSVFHHWQILCKLNWPVKSVSTSNMCQSSSCSSNYMYTTVTYYCLTLNSWTIFTNVHSIDKNTIYTYKYNLLNWFFIHLR